MWLSWGWHCCWREISGGIQPGATRHYIHTHTYTHTYSVHTGLWQWGPNTDRILHIPDIARGWHRRQMGGVGATHKGRFGEWLWRSHGLFGRTAGGRSGGWTLYYYEYSRPEDMIYSGSSSILLLLFHGLLLIK